MAASFKSKTKLKRQHNVPGNVPSNEQSIIEEIWAAQPGPQVDAILATWCPELFYGGAAGGGKSDYLLGDFLQDVPRYGAAWRGILFRRTYGELQDLIDRSHELYPQTGAKWNEQKHRWRWPNGATLRFRYLELDKHKSRYQGTSWTWIGWDELTQWATDGPYRYLRARLRSKHNVPTKRIRSTANPGGPGHHWVKAYFITPARGGYVPVINAETKERRIFIPARLTDNKILLKSDPFYKDRLKGLGSVALVKAWLEGDWDVVEGAYFDCWRQRMIIPPCEFPRHWTRFRSGDWGSASPFSFGWWVVVQDDFRHPKTDRLIPRGAIVRYREWYGSKNPALDGQRGLKLTADQVGERLVTIEKHDPKLSYGVLDPSAFNADKAPSGHFVGPSIAERINDKLEAAKLIGFHRADNTRVSARDSKDRHGAMSGWDQMRGRMVGRDGRPMIYCFETCVASIRTIPAMQHDPSYPEDVDTNSEDHAADDWRYGCSSRPYNMPKPTREEPKDGYADVAEEYNDSFKTL